MSRRGVLALVAAVSVLAAGLGWVLGQQIKSPAEVALETAAPEPSLITVPVELKELSSRVVVRGTVQSSEETPINISGAADGTPIVTRMPKEAGDVLDEGEVVVEITGRPVVALQGDLPVYRAMGPSMEGPDVRQLEEALLRLGYNPGDVDGTYTAATASAIDELYLALGYKSNGPSAEERAAVDSAKERVTQAERLVTQTSSSGSSGGVPDSVKLQADQEVSLAERQLADANAAKAVGTKPFQDEVDAASSAHSAATADLNGAKQRLEAAVGGTHPDTGQPPTEAELDELRGAVAEAEAAVADRSNELDAAKDSLANAAVELDRAVTDATVTVNIAIASRKETFASYTNPSGDGEGATTSAADAKAELADAKDALAELQSTVGVNFPAFELVFVPSLPRKVQSVSVKLGSPAQGSVMSVTGTSTIMNAVVSASDRKLLVNGLDAIIEDDELGISVPAKITFLADEPGSSDGQVAADRYEMRFTPEGDLPEEAFYQSLRVTIPISSTGGDVLAVPLAAVSAGADGSSRVEVQEASGSTRLVRVVTGLSADGFVEVDPVDDELEDGDRVVVGQDLQLPGSDDESEDGEGDSGEDEEGEASDE